jgi:hypothetical protein
MKKLYLAVLFGIFLVSCKKFIQNQEQKKVIQEVTNGLWYVTSYNQNDSNMTAAFSGYVFKFDQNNTVTGVIGTDSTQGQWVVDVNAKTITSDFPGAPQPLSLLNETWLIEDSYTDSVSAKSTDTVNNTISYLQLKKQ